MSGLRAARTVDDARAEALRSLRSTVKFASGERPIRSLLVVDLDREQPSDIARQLAGTYADAGDRCLLIETDGRGEQGRGAGFYDLLRGTATADTPATRADGDLSMLGPGQGASPDLLAGDAFGAALDGLLGRHGFAILSCAPLPRFADALAIAPRVDAVILVVTAGQTRRPRAVEARDALERVGTRLLGVVMVEPKRRWFW